MIKYCIRHIPTKTWFYDDEAGTWLTEEPERFFEDRKHTELFLDDMAEFGNGEVTTEDGSFSKYEFEIVKFEIKEVK